MRVVVFEQFNIGVLGDEPFDDFGDNLVDEDTENQEIEEDEQEDGEEGSHPLNFMGQFNLPTKVDAIVDTPIGKLPYDVSYLSFYSGWWFVVHTSFKISAQEMMNLSNVDGVDFIRQIAPHRFVLGIAPLFIPSEVQKDILETLKAQLFDINSDSEEVSEENRFPQQAEIQDLIEIKMQAAGQTHWVVYHYPNGHQKIWKCKTELEVDKALKEAQEFQLLSSGIIFSSKK